MVARETGSFGLLAKEAEDRMEAKVKDKRSAANSN